MTPPGPELDLGPDAPIPVLSGWEQALSSTRAVVCPD